MTDVNPRTFDLGAALAGITYPEETIPVFFDQALSYELANLDRKIRIADGEALKKLTALRNELIEKTKSAAILVKLRGVPRELRKATLDSVTAEYPIEYNAFGQAQPNPEADDVYARKIWALHLVSITGPDGSVLEPVTEADVDMFRSKAPDTAIGAVEQGIARLTDDTKTGYDTAIRDIDFLSRP